jgi:hypothetical protein
MDGEEGKDRGEQASADCVCGEGRSRKKGVAVDEIVGHPCEDLCLSVSTRGDLILLTKRNPVPNGAEAMIGTTQ